MPLPFWHLHSMLHNDIPRVLMIMLRIKKQESRDKKMSRGLVEVLIMMNKDIHVGPSRVQVIVSLFLDHIYQFLSKDRNEFKNDNFWDFYPNFERDNSPVGHGVVLRAGIIWK